MIPTPTREFEVVNSGAEQSLESWIATQLREARRVLNQIARIAALDRFCEILKSAPSISELLVDHGCLEDGLNIVGRQSQCFLEQLTRALGPVEHRVGIRQCDQHVGIARVDAELRLRQLRSPLGEVECAEIVVGRVAWLDGNRFFIQTYRLVITPLGVGGRAKIAVSARVIGRKLYNGLKLLFRFGIAALPKIEAAELVVGIPVVWPCDDNIAVCGYRVRSKAKK